jgi:hypothetical protein
MYPILDLKAGAESVRTHATKPIPVNTDQVELWLAEFKRSLICNFWSKRSCQLMKISTKRMTDCRLKNILNSGRIPSMTESFNIPLRDWIPVEFKKNFDLDCRDDALDLIDDKSIAPPLSQKDSIYATDVKKVHRELERYDYSSLSPRRLIQYILSQENLNTKELVEWWDDLITIPKDLLLILLTSKEREHKSDPRMFGVQVTIVRIINSIAESNLYDQILPFFSSQSITSTGVQLSRRIDSMASLMQTEDHFWGISLDFSKWNTCHRFELVHPFEKKQL